MELYVSPNHRPENPLSSPLLRNPPSTNQPANHHFPDLLGVFVVPIRAQEVDWSARAHPIMLRKKPFDLITDARSCPSLSSAAVVEAGALAAAVGLAQLVDTGAVVVVRKLVAGLAGPEGVPAAALVKTRLGRLHLVVPVGVVYSPLLAPVPNQAILERDLMQILRFFEGETYWSRSGEWHRSTCDQPGKTEQRRCRQGQQQQR